MGVNIHVTRRDGERDDRFDWFRCAGDRDFVLWLWDGHCVREPLFDQEYGYRPDDFAAARAWVQDNITQHGDGNLRRMTGLLDLLEADADLWLDISW